VVAALGDRGVAVLQAPPGAGKTTRVPLALLEAPWMGGGRIVMLEPRRVAARAAADRLAASLGGKVGGLVGYRIRNDTRVGPQTRIEVVTEGVLTRMLQADPSLEGVDAVIFDEFHERSLHADLGLALTLEARAALRADLRLLVMSATLDGERVAGLLGDAPIVTSEGRQYPVETVHHAPLGGQRIEDHMVGVIADIWHLSTGDVLGFLPGAGWIRRVENALRSRLPADTVIAPLYGALNAEDQDRAIHPDPRGRRKVVLATDIAETSLTIDGVSVVVDSGQRRSPRFDPRSGLTRLVTGRVSLASADQRRGRAGRQGPGVCHRLWPEAEHRHLDPFDAPQISSADLTGLRLQLAQWGSDASELAWLDPPPTPALAEAEALLEQLGAMSEGRITPHGVAILDVGAEPRLAHMMVRAAELGHGGLACDIAGLLSGRDPAETRSADLTERVMALRSGRARGGWRDALTSADRWRRRIGATKDSVDPGSTGLVVALAFPDRVGQQRGAAGNYRLSSGRGAVLPATDPLAGSEYLAVADVDGDPVGGRIYLAAALDRADLDAALGDSIVREAMVTWDVGAGDVVAEHRTSLGALVLKREPMTKPPAQALAGAWASAVATEGLGLLDFSPEVDGWRNRVTALRISHGDDWPDVSDAALLASTDAWLAPHLTGVRRRRDLARIDLRSTLGALLDWNQARRLDKLAPTHIAVPSGNRVRLDYTEPDAPVLAVRLQEIFGLTETPTIAQGRIAVVVHLLSPAQRPVQVTRDLAGFWANTYPEVKKELKGRYPKHHWPDDPLTATATDRIKRRS
jgi:ATP-dependent helicase HrpB